GQNLPTLSTIDVITFRKYNQTRHRGNVFVRRFNRNSKINFVRFARFDAGMSNNGVALWQRKKIEGRIIRYILACDLEMKIGTGATPTGSCSLGIGKVLRQ